MQDRKARLILNSGYSLLSWLAPLAFGLVVPPILLAALGKEEYGVYLVLLGFVSFSFAFSAGRTLAKFVSEFNATGQQSRINDAVSSAFWLNVGVGLVGASTVALISRWLVSDVLQVAPEYQTVAEQALLLGGFSIPATLIAQVFQNVLQGLHRFGAVSLISNLNWLVLNAGNVVVVISGLGIVGLLAWNLATAIGLAVVSFFSARRLGSDYSPRLTVDRNVFIAVASYGSGIFFYQFFGVVLFLFERGWLISSFGAAESAFYLLPMTLALYLHGLIGSLSLAVFPVVNELLTNRAQLVSLYQKATKAVFAITAFSVATVICTGRHFLHLWVGVEFAQNAYVILVFHFLTFGLVAVMIIIWQVNEAHRAARINAVQAFIWASIAIPLMIWTSGFWSSEGVAASRFIAVLLTVPLLLYCERRFLGGVFWSFWGWLVIRVSLGVGVLAIIERSVLASVEPSWFWLIVASTAGTVAFATVVWLTGLIASDEKALLLKIVLGRSQEASLN